MIRGMTGFGRAQGQAPWGVWVWEARSVNGKSVDIRTNYPPGCDAIDFEARKRVKDRFQRGSSSWMPAIFRPWKSKWAASNSGAR